VQLPQRSDVFRTFIEGRKRVQKESAIAQVDETEKYFQ
jgi:hypothetical protein